MTVFINNLFFLLPFIFWQVGGTAQLWQFVGIEKGWLAGGLYKTRGI
jgi:hypothetical protein